MRDPICLGRHWGSVRDSVFMWESLCRSGETLPQWKTPRTPSVSAKRPIWPPWLPYISMWLLARFPDHLRCGQAQTKGHESTSRGSPHDTAQRASVRQPTLIGSTEKWDEVLAKIRWGNEWPTPAQFVGSLMGHMLLSSFFFVRCAPLGSVNYDFVLFR